MEFLRHPPKEFVHPEWINKYGDKIRKGDTFVYEMAAYRIYPDRAEMLFSKYFESEKELVSKYSVEYYPNKKKKKYIIEKTISMVEAPESYLRYLPLYEPNNKKKNEKRSSNLQKRRVR